MFVEWLLNRIFYEVNQVWANLGVFLLYGLINITVTYTTGKPVYKPISWDSVTTWLLGLGMLPMAVAFYFVLYYLTWCKFRVMRMHDSIEYEAAPSSMATQSQDSSALPSRPSKIGVISETGTKNSTDRANSSDQANFYKF